MASIRKRGNKLHIRYYDKISGTEKSFSTKLKATKEGWAQARQMLKQINLKLEVNDNFIEFAPTKIFNDGYNEYKSLKTFKKKTWLIYDKVINYFISCCGDKKINLYTKNDYKKFVLYLGQKNLTQTSKGIYIAHLHALFEYFKNQNYIKENIIERIQRTLKPIEIIDDKDLRIMFDYLREHNKEHYYFLMFLLVTGFRISTAVALTWEQIDFNKMLIYADNVKKNRGFVFPLTNDLIKLLNEIGIKEKGKIFNFKSTESLKFFPRLQKKLISLGLIEKHYTLHQFRKTFVTKMLEAGVSIFDVSKLADHKNIQTTIKHYAFVEAKRLKETVDKVGNITDNFTVNDENKLRLIK